jgi:hypothetical protein
VRYGICGSYCSQYEDYAILAYDAVRFSRRVSTLKMVAVDDAETLVTI